ncbi:MAG TPA: hypothetical protein VNM68_05490 [Candidatus Polarisedimenticolia bacterium]|nr:hypothetical protein [Candidatus Polarisedimenticolia bacterium]
MGMSACYEFLNQLDAWMDGERPAAAREHLRDCPRCRSLADDLGAIRQAAHNWAAEVDPPSRLWTSLRTQLEQEGLIHEGHRRKVLSLTRWLDDLFAVVSRPALAGAYLIALIAVGVALIGPTNKQLIDTRWMERTQIFTNPLSAQLDTAERDMISSLPGNSAVTASLHQNLAIVDNYIALCEKSVREEPQNEVARDYLYGAFQQKADLLAQISERGEYGQ